MRPVVLCGWSRSGKDTIADHLVSRHGYRKLSTGEAVMGVIAAFNPWIPTPRPAAPFAGARLNLLLATLGYEGSKGIPEVGRALQDVGAHLNQVDALFLVRAILDGVPEGVPWVVTGVRDLDQLVELERRGAVSVWVDRPGSVPKNGHPVELAVTQGSCQFTIVNDREISDLHDAVDVLIEQGLV
jgi:hypothetical protein